MTFSDAVELAIVHEAECWCPGCGESTRETFIELLTWLMVSDPATFARAINDIVNEIHSYEGEAQAA